MRALTEDAHRELCAWARELANIVAADAPQRARLRGKA